MLNAQSTELFGQIYNNNLKPAKATIFDLKSVILWSTFYNEKIGSNQKMTLIKTHHILVASVSVPKIVTLDEEHALTQ